MSVNKTNLRAPPTPSQIAHTCADSFYHFHEVAISQPYRYTCDVSVHVQRLHYTPAIIRYT